MNNYFCNYLRTDGQPCPSWRGHVAPNAWDGSRRARRTRLSAGT